MPLKITGNDVRRNQRSFSYALTPDQIDQVKDAFYLYARSRTPDINIQDAEYSRFHKQLMKVISRKRKI